MRSVLKTATLESKFPLLSVEQGCIISKDADITVAFQVMLPELFTVTSEEYEAMHSVWNKAIKVLPNYSIVHKQDWYIKENYQHGQPQDQDLSFLSSSFECHFNERPYLSHTCYLFLTKTTKERSRQQSTFSSLGRGTLLPKEIKNKESVLRFVEAVNQFEQIINDSDFIRLTRFNGMSRLPVHWERTGSCGKVLLTFSATNCLPPGHHPESGRNENRGQLA